MRNVFVNWMWIEDNNNKICMKLARGQYRVAWWQQQQQNLHDWCVVVMNFSYLFVVFFYIFDERDDEVVILKQGQVKQLNAFKEKIIKTLKQVFDSNLIQFHFVQNYLKQTINIQMYVYLRFQNNNEQMYKNLRGTYSSHKNCTVIMNYIFSIWTIYVLTFCALKYIHKHA